MAAAVPSCELLASHCRESYDILVCEQSFMACEETVGKHFLSGVVPGGWDPYDVRHTCETPPLCSSFAHGRSWEYFNQPWVQEQLGQSYYPFELIDFDTGIRWQQAKSLYLPVTREMTWLLDNTDIRILFINGNDDIVILPNVMHGLITDLVTRLVKCDCWTSSPGTAKRSTEASAIKVGTITRETSHPTSKVMRNEGAFGKARIAWRCILSMKLDISHLIISQKQLAQC
ncbi:hypothetical protein NW766_006425 [Fusarium irregulare]|uniref:Uncharacterized protein n=1 Tax=Fusarium irregulare TaxID=2494466 RepID=A0A9W8UB22_9HYPO|nr:hypothetical protein NW766_006425 [Fusarium irregulare]